jgi:hypothetical protein
MTPSATVSTDETFADRVRRAMEARSKGFNDLDKAMGKKPGYTSKVLGEGRDPRGDSIRMFGKALNVRSEWLLTGNGPMEAPSPTLELDDAYPARAAAIVAARGLGVPEPVLADVRAIEWKGDGDPGLAYWAKEIEARASGRRPSAATKPSDPAARVGALDRRSKRKIEH